MRSAKWAALGTMVALCIVAGPVFAWGDEGHEIVGLIAQHYLDARVATKVKTLLATDTTGLASIANKLITKRAQWSKGVASDWSIETYAVSKVNAYGPLPAPGAGGTYTLPASYVTNAKGVVADQLSKAGVRLAFVLNDALK